MPAIDYSTQEVRLRYVLIGPRGAGKATTLRRLHAGLLPYERTDIVVTPAEPGEVLSFEFVPGDLLPLAEYRPRATVATVSGADPGGPVWARTCAEADALLFVADSRRPQLAENVAALRQFAAVRGLREVPLVFFYNQRDHAEITSLAELEARLNPLHAPHRAGNATTGEGLEGLLADLTRVTFSHAE